MTDPCSELPRMANPPGEIVHACAVAIQRASEPMWIGVAAGAVVLMVIGVIVYGMVSIIRNSFT